MELKVLAIISMLIGASLGQNISCSYSDTNISGDLLYTCNLNINNPNGFDGFTTIDGTHLAGRTNADVRAVLVTRPSTSTIFPQIVCTQFTNLVHVESSYTDVESIGQNSFSQCANLEWLRLWDNRIETVHAQAFANNNNLRHLDMGLNNLRQLPETVFNNLGQLETLRLSNNQLGNIPNGLLANLGSLRQIMLTQTGLTEFRTQWFSNLANLEFLILAENQISQLPANAFDSLTNLLVLDISYNPITDLGDSFRRLVNLRDLHIQSLRIGELNPIWFENHPRLEILHMHSNQLTSIPPNTFDSLVSLRVLDISNNSLSEEGIPANLFDNLTNLTLFGASRNLIRNLNPQWFQNLRQLRFLRLNFNQISALPRGVFSSFTGLEQIHMQGNNLRTLSSDSFGNLLSLVSADFNFNSIDSIDEILLRRTRVLLYFNLLDNICANSGFPDINRQNFLTVLANCVRNFKITNEISTVPSDDFEFFPATGSGIRFHVTGIYRSAHVLLVSDQNPLDSIMIRIGSLNNTATRIFRGDELVSILPTPGVLIDGQWNSFRLSWANNVITVSARGDRLPFVSFEMDINFPVNSYGVRNNHPAIWNILPLERN